jgi:hypothetical protein
LDSWWTWILAAAILVLLWPHKDITQAGKVYLRRYFLSPKFLPWRLYLHFIFLSDADRAPHNHPWSFWTWVAWGGYVEEIYEEGEGRKAHLVKYDLLTPGSCRFRHATRIHKVAKLLSGLTITLVLVHKTEASWGFYTEDGYVDQTTYKKAQS